jgi:coniferyl-aldehyde dehydrogenase
MNVTDLEVAPSTGSETTRSGIAFGPVTAVASESTLERMTAQLDAMRAASRRQRRAPSLEERIVALDTLERMLLGNKEAFCKAISEDFGHRSRHETLLAEIYIVHATLKHARDHLAEWMGREDRDVNLTFFPARAEVVMQPLGVVGIISPWNYPVQLALSPLVGALAAGNRAMLKPSELVPETSALLMRLVSEVFSSEQVVVCTGGVQVATDFASLAFDHIIFTGSTHVGKLIMRAAATHLVPVTLELGGKSPAVVGPDFPIAIGAERIIGGKLLNAGQTCIAPDYALVPKGKVDAFVTAAKEAAARLYPTLLSNVDYSAIVSVGHHQRLSDLLADAAAKGAQLVELNPANEDFAAAATRKMPLTLVLHATDEMRLLQDEIFGPILPVVSYESVAEAIDYINARPRPLALYVFDHDMANVEQFVAETTSGGVTVNDTMLHIAQDSLPFGGVGPSGMGHYHGKEGFLALSKMKPVVYQSRLNATGVMRPPYGASIDFVIKMLIGK